MHLLHRTAAHLAHHHLEPAALLDYLHLAMDLLHLFHIIH